MYFQPANGWSVPNIFYNQPSGSEEVQIIKSLHAEEKMFDEQKKKRSPAFCTAGKFWGDFRHIQYVEYFLTMKMTFYQYIEGIE